MQIARPRPRTQNAVTAIAPRPLSEKSESELKEAYTMSFTNHVNTWKQIPYSRPKHMNSNV